MRKGEKMQSFATKHNDANASLGWPERIGYGVGQFGINSINAVLGSFLTVYFTDVALLDAGIIASIIAISKLFDGISDLIVGNMVDHTHSKLGKARPWLLRMCIPFAISVLLLFYVPANFPMAVKYVYVFVMYNIVNTVCFTAMNVPFYSMISLITKNPYERGFLGNVQQIFQTLGNVVINAVFVTLLAVFSTDAANPNTQRAYTCAMLVISIVMIIAALVTVMFTKERVTDDEEAPAAAETEKKAEKKDKASTMAAIKALLTNKYWVMLTIFMFVIFFVIIFYAMGAVYYAMVVFNDMGQYSWMANSISIAQFLIMFATPVLMKKIDKTKIYTVGILLLTLGFAGFGLFATSKGIMIACNVLKGCGLGMAGGMALGMVADTITYGTLKSGIDAVGMGNAGVSAAQKLGMGLGTAVFGWVLSAAGYDGAAAVQSEAVITAVKFLYNWVPCIMCAIVFVMLILFYGKIEKELPEMQAKAAKAE